MKKNIFLGLLLISLVFVARGQEPFIRGIKNAQIFSKEQAENGSSYKYSCGRTFDIQFYFEQFDVLFYARDEFGQKKRLMVHFEVGYETDGEMRWTTDNVQYLVGQYDFDGDDIDELIIALQSQDISVLNGISFNVLKLVKGEWEVIGQFSAQGIGGEPIAEVKVNHIKVDRNLRGFYYRWTYSFERGAFIDTGDY